jgi:folate-dependent phosphoribosylglycinamide formyltransferase PurN
MQLKKIIFLASDCESSRWVYNALIKEFEIDAVIIEHPVNKISLIKGRIKRIGIIKVLGQIMFSLLVVPCLKLKAKKRRDDLVKLYQLSDSEFTPGKTFRVVSVNEEACKVLLEQLQPGIIIVNGTRIISKKILQCCNAVFINMHAGITPRYRGSHGGYWALQNNDAANFGTTIHLVDAGVDTGAVLKQVFINPIKDDNFTTYPILQVAIGISALKEVLLQVEKENYIIRTHSEKGKMYYQPSIREYFWGHTKPDL